MEDDELMRRWLVGHGHDRNVKCDPSNCIYEREFEYRLAERAKLVNATVVELGGEWKDVLLWARFMMVCARFPLAVRLASRER
jgi:hypothetical protein